MNNFVENKKQFFAYLAKQIIRENNNVYVPYRGSLGEDISACYDASLSFYQCVKRSSKEKDVRKALENKKSKADTLFENHNIVWPF